MNIKLAEHQPRPTYPLTHDECVFNSNGNDFTCDHTLLTAIYLNLVDYGKSFMTGNELIQRVMQTQGCEEYMEQSPYDTEQIILRELENSLHRGLLTINSQQVTIAEQPPNYPDLGGFSFAQMQDQDWFICPNGKMEKLFGLQKILYPLLDGKHHIAEINNFLDNADNFKNIKMGDYNGNNPQHLDFIQQQTKQHALKLLDILHDDGVFATYNVNPTLKFYKSRKPKRKKVL